MNLSDIVFMHAAIKGDVASNGGPMGSAEVLNLRHDVFPLTLQTERTAGITHWRKLFCRNVSPSNDLPASAYLFQEHPTPGGDHILIGLGTPTDTQADVVSAPPLLVGCGQLNADIAADATTITVAMAVAGIPFPNGGLVYVSNQFKTGQTAGGGVVPGDHVDYSGGTWNKGVEADPVYPHGIWLGSGLVRTNDGDAEGWKSLADNLYESEAIGTGNGVLLAPELDDLDNATNGICAQSGKLPVVTATCGGEVRTVNVAADGTCSGYCTAGELNMATGVWTTDISWNLAPDNTENVAITYRENCYSYSGGVAAVELAETVGNAFAAADTYVSGVIECGDQEATVENFTEVSSAGTYDESSNPVAVNCAGTIYARITLTFTSATAFNATSPDVSGLGSGAISADFEPEDGSGNVLFSVPSAAWGGTWAVGDTITFTTYPAAQGFWLKHVVPAGCAAATGNLTHLGWIVE